MGSIFHWIIVLGMIGFFVALIWLVISWSQASTKRQLDQRQADKQADKP